MGEPVIEIRRGETGFVVEVVPPQPGHPPRHYDNSKSAFGHAGGVRMVTGWRKVDLTGGDAPKGA